MDSVGNTKAGFFVHGMHAWRGNWTVNYTCPQRFINIKPFLASKALSSLIEFLVSSLTSGVQTFKPISLIHRMDNIVCNHWGFIVLSLKIPTLKTFFVYPI